MSADEKVWDLGEMQRIFELLRTWEVSDTDHLKHILEDHDRWHKDIIARRLVEANGK